MFSVVVGHTYQFLLFATLYGQQMLNRFSYTVRTVGETPVVPADMMNTFLLEVLPAIQAITCDAAEFTKIQVRHLGVPGEGTWETLLTGEAGDINSTTHPPGASFIALSFRLYTSLGISRSGWKRFGGVPKAIVINGVYNPVAVTGYSTAVTALISTLESDQEFAGSGNVWGPSVVRNEGTPSSPSYVPHYVESVSEARIGTQNSRKINYGD